LDEKRLRDLARRVVLRAVNRDEGAYVAYDRWRLIRAGDHGEQLAVDAVWEAWLHRPDKRWWTALSRWRRTADPGSDLRGGHLAGARALLFTPGQRHALSLAALDDPSIGWSAEGVAHAVSMNWHPIAAIARRRILDLDEVTRIDDVCLAAVDRLVVLNFLVRHDVQPADEPLAAAFLLLTRQQERYWQHDPDQVLLARAYRERPALRPALRDAIPMFGDLDAARVLLTATAGIAKEPSEITYLARRLAEQHDWDELWRFAQALPPAEASQALREATTDWRPPDLDEAELYLLLCRAETAGLLNRVTALSSPRRFEVDGLVQHGAFSADDTTAAVIVQRGGRVVAQVIDLERGKTTESYDLGNAGHGPVSFDGRRPIACQPWPGGPAPTSTVWWLGSSRRAGRPLRGWAVDLRPVTADGTAHVALVVQAWRQSPGLMIVRRHGPPAVRSPHISGANGLPFGRTSPGPLLATDPASGRIAVGESHLMVAELGRGNRLRGLAHAPRASERPYRALCFDGPDHLLASDDFGVRRLRITDGRLPVVSSTDAVRGPLARVAYRNAVAVADFKQGIVYLDAETLEPQARPGDLTGTQGRPVLWASPSGSHAACLDFRTVHVVLASAVALADVARRPLNETAPGDAAALAAARRHPELQERAGVLLDILETNRTLREQAEAT
jgi:hypothetical protein